MPDPVLSGDTPVRHLWPVDRQDRGRVGTLALTCLRRARILTVADLTARTPEEILDLRHTGPAVVTEIRRALARHGLSLHGDVEATVSDVEARVHRLTAAGISRPAALRFARESWPKGEIAAGIVLEVRDV